MWRDWEGWRPYVSVGERRRTAEFEIARLRKQGRRVSPVVIDGRTIAHTFWGKAWCDNLEHYSDYENRLPRGRTYVRNGSVVDLQIAPGEVKALVSGTGIYRVEVRVAPVPAPQWTAICTDCAGAIDSLVELLQGRFARGVMERICQPRTGLFPMPDEIQFSCSCPDWASMCKHVAAVLYGIGARLDERPALLFKLRKVDENELIAHAGDGLPLAKEGPGADKVLAADGLSELFGLELGTGEAGPAPAASTPAPAKPARKARAAARPLKAKRATEPAKPKRERAKARRTARVAAAPPTTRSSAKPRRPRASTAAKQKPLNARPKEGIKTKARPKPEARRKADGKAKPDPRTSAKR